jgi:hypothetical protein
MSLALWFPGLLAALVVRLASNIQHFFRHDTVTFLPYYGGIKEAAGVVLNSVAPIMFTELASIGVANHHGSRRLGKIDNFA